MMFNIMQEKFTGLNERYAQFLSFLIKLNIFAVPLYALLVSGVTFAPLQALIADITMSMLAMAGYSPAISDLLISIPIKNGSWAAYISWDCTAWKSLLAFFALTMAAPRPNKAKAIGLAVFLPLIFAVNIARIFFMFLYVSTFDLAYYSVVHDVVWSWGMIFAVLALWLAWMRYNGNFGLCAVWKRIYSETSK
jgi:exosortase/archaeosortase family protein